MERCRRFFTAKNSRPRITAKWIHACVRQNAFETPEYSRTSIAHGWVLVRHLLLLLLLMTDKDLLLLLSAPLPLGP
jgi:hypothetical protein